ncbi:MAG: VOC family protein [Chloroflexota bacterium]|nr:VOC family protein [Chloroflexota bacterium]
MANEAILGLHHLTAIATNAQATVDFWTETLGLRLVKQTVNFDDPSAYHLYFGNDAADPGSLVTFFEWRGMAPGRTGIGATHHVALRTRNRDTLLQWKRWLADRGVDASGPYDRVYFTSIYLRDPSGLIVEIATEGPGWTVDEAPDALGSGVRMPPPETMRDGRDEAAIAAETWPEPIETPTPEMRLERLHHVTAIASDAARTEAFWTETLGLRLVKRTVNFDDPSSPHLYFGVGEGAPGTVVTYFAYPPGTMPYAQVGAGLTHHFALEVADDAAQRAWQERLNRAGVSTTPVLDRRYFKSIYFQDPDGHILEIATRGPGFAVDEAPDALGQSLQLPPSLDGQRERIAAALTPLRVPTPAGSGR